MIDRVWNYLNEPGAPSTQTCRIKIWAHDNAFTFFWLHIIELLLIAILAFKVYS